MDNGEVLAYLAGMVDGDGYLKITKSPPLSVAGHPYYGITIGVQQLAPGPAVKLFAATFGGRLMPLMKLPGHRPIARCEVHSRKAEDAARRLLPYLLVKRDQALMLLQVRRIRMQTGRRSQERFERLEAVRHWVLSLHNGESGRNEAPESLDRSLRGYECLGPPEMGWTREQICAYLAGIMDSDGNFRVEKRNVRGMLHPHYRICIRCAQVAPSPAVELLADTFGGSTSLKHDTRPNARDLITWSLHDRAAVPAINAMLPYLIVKQIEAWLLLELRGLKEVGKKGTTVWVHPNRWQENVKMRKRCFTPEQVSGFERTYRAIRERHSGAHTGRSPIPPHGSLPYESQPSVPAARG